MILCLYTHPRLIDRGAGERLGIRGRSARDRGDDAVDSLLIGRRKGATRRPPHSVLAAPARRK